MARKVYVEGFGMTPFIKPSENDPDYREMAKAVITSHSQAPLQLRPRRRCHLWLCLRKLDLRTEVRLPQRRAVYEVDKSSVPIYNFNNYCATGSTALHLDKNLIAGGIHNCVLAVSLKRWMELATHLRKSRRAKFTVCSQSCSAVQPMQQCFATKQR